MVRDDNEAAQAIIRVGDGRGFIVQGKKSRYVITAAHCLPFLPPCCVSSHTDERTYADLLGTLDNEERSVSAECVFADPIGDIAVLGPPDSQELCEEAEAYDALVDAVEPMAVGVLPDDAEINWSRCSLRSSISASATLK